MGLDVLCVVLAAAFFVLGLLSGLLTQLVRLVALVGAFLLAYWAASYTKPFLMNWISLDNLAGDLLALFLGWIVCYLFLRIAGTILAKAIRRTSPSVRVLDRVLGGALGSAKGFLIVYLIACALVLVREPLGVLIPPEHLDLEGSRLAAFAEEHNLLSRLIVPELDRLRELATALGGRRAPGAFSAHPALEPLRQNRAFRVLMGDPSVLRAAREGRMGELLANPRVRAALRDPEIREILSKLDLDKLRDEIQGR